MGLVGRSSTLEGLDCQSGATELQTWVDIQVDSRGQGVEDANRQSRGETLQGYKSTINCLLDFLQKLLFIEHEHVRFDIDHRDHWLFRVKTTKT